MTEKLFDLQREKYELDAFLSTVLEETVFLPIKDNLQAEEKISPSAENDFALKAAREKENKFKLISPGEWSNANMREGEPVGRVEKTRFDETTQSDGHGRAKTSPRQEKRTSTKPMPEKTINKVNTKVYDFAPEKKNTGIGKWIWILILLMLALFAVYFWIYPECISKTLEMIKSYSVLFF